MAKEIDEKIVEMRFENKNFEEGAKQTIKSIEKLNASTETLGENTGSFEKLIQSINEVNKHFGVMETIARGALERIGYQAVATGEQFVKSLTVDQITAGWSKYTEKTRSVKTIMNATGDSIGKVNEYLEKLMWYTDETSYNFVDMTSNIGKFTAQGVALDDATTAMMGISNWAAQAGQGVNEASRAMYNLSQALGLGEVRIQDWMSVENANMATKEFKEMAIETAKELGTLTKAGMDAKNELVTFKTFRETLADGWFTSDVLIATLKKYGAYTEEVYKLTQEQGISAAEAMEMLGDAYGGVGERAFKAAQVSKTFSDAVDATVDAASSRWMALFEVMFGNLEQQEKLWTEFTAFLYDAFVAGMDGVMEAMYEWQDMEGPLYFINAFLMAMQGVLGVIQMFGNAWEKAFGPITGNTIMGLVNILANLVALLTPTETFLDNISSALGGVLSVFGAFGRIVGAVAKGFTPLLYALNGFIGLVGAVLGVTGDAITGLVNMTVTEERLAAVTNVIYAVTSAFVSGLVELAKLVGAVGFIFADAFSYLTFSWEDGIGGFPEFVSAIQRGFSELAQYVNFQFDFGSMFASAETFFVNLQQKVSGPLGAIIQSISEFFGYLSGASANLEGMSMFEKVLSTIQMSLQYVGQAFASAGTNLANFAGVLRNLLGPLGIGVTEFLDYLYTRATELSTGDIFDVLLAINVGKLLQPMNDISSAMGDMMENIGEMLKTASDTMETFQSKLKADALYTIAKAIGILAVSLLLLSSVPIANLAVSTTALVALGAGLAGLMYALNKITDEWEDERIQQFRQITISLLPLSATIVILSSAIKKLASLDPVGVALAVGAVGILMAELVGFIKFTEDKEIKKATTASLVSLAFAIRSMVSPLKKLGQLDLATLAKGLGALAVVIAELAAFTYVAGMSGANSGMLGASVGLIAMVAACRLLIPVMEKYAELPWETVGAGLLKFGAALAVLVAGMVGLSFAGTAGAAGAAGLAALAASFALLLPQMAIIAAFSWESIGKVILMFAGVLGTFTVAGLALAPVGPIFLTIAGAIAAFNLSVAAIIASLSLLVLALPAAVAGFIAFSSMSEDEVQRGVNNIDILLNGLIDTFIGLKAKLKMAALIYLEGIIEALIETAPDIANGVLIIIDEILAALETHLPGILEKVDNILTDLEPYAEKFGRKGAEIAVGFAKGVVDGLWSKASETAASIGEWLDSVLFGGAGKARQDRMTKYYAEEGLKIQGQVAENAKNYYNTFEGEMERNRNKAVNAGTSMGKGLLEGYDKAVDQHSPPGEAISRADWFVGTFADSIKAGFGKIGQTGTDLAKSLLGGIDEETETSMPKTTEKVSNSFNEGIAKSGMGSNAAKTAAKQIDEDKELEKAAKKKAEAVAKAFQTEFEKIDIRLGTIGSTYGIAEAYLGPDAEEQEKNMLKLAQLQKELAVLGDKYSISWDKYQNALANPKTTQIDIDKAKNEYLKVYEELAKKANEVASLQKEMYGSFQDAEMVVFDELKELGAARQQLVQSGEQQMSEATKEAYQNFLHASTEEQKQYYYELWQQLREQDAAGIFGDILAKPIDPNEIRNEVYTALGLDPNNPVEAFMSVPELVNKAVAASQETYLQAVEETYPGIIQAYETKLAESADEVVEFVENEVSPKYARAGAEMADNTAEGMEVRAPQVQSKAESISTMSSDAVMKKTEDWVEVGSGMMDGIIKGIENQRAEVINAAITVCRDALSAAKQELGIASPSKEFLAVGMYTMEGMANGIERWAANPIEAAKTVTDNMLEPFSDINRRVTDVMGSSLNPVITPSLDLRGAERGATYLNRMWRNRTYDIAGTLRMRDEASRTQMDAIETALKREPTVVNNNTFNQTNNSPKALSTADIYRDTRSMFSRFGRGVR